MGQAFMAVNFDKKEKLNPHDYDNGYKLMEFSYQGNNFVGALEELMSNDWKGDRVLVIGDYINEVYNNRYNSTEARIEPYSEMLEKLAEEFGIKDACQEVGLAREQYAYDLYDYADDNFKGINLDVERIVLPYRYVYNLETETYYDLKDQPVQWSGYDKKTGEIYGTKIHPLPLALCCGNGSGGSYFGINENRVGEWALTSQSICISNEPISEYSHFEKITDVFDERMKDEKEKDGINNLNILKTTIKKIVENVVPDLDTLSFTDDLFLTADEIAELKDFAKECLEQERSRIRNQFEPDICD